MKNFPNVLISVLNWNNSSDTIRCIHSLKKLTYSNYSIVVVDNGSKDHSAEKIQKEFPEIHLIKSAQNLGYAGGNKLACDYGNNKGYELFWIVNNDSVVQHDCLENLVSAYQQKGEGLFGGISLKEDNETISFSGGFELDTNGKVMFGNYSIHSGKPKSAVFQSETVREVADVNGACMMIPYSIIKKYGFIDNSFFLYGEELDYCFRLRKQSGIKSFLVSTAIVKHEGSTSLNKNENLKKVKTYYLTRNYSYFRYTHELKTKTEVIHSYNYSLVQILAVYILKKIKGKDYFLATESNAERLGLYDFFIGKTGKVFEPNHYI